MNKIQKKDKQKKLFECYWKKAGNMIVMKIVSEVMLLKCENEIQYWIF